MSYQRGGKVWVEENGCGWVALERDWSGDGLPEDLVSEAGLVGVDFELVNYKTRASIGGYSKFEEKWFFFLSKQTIEFHHLESASVYLVGDFNDWEPSSLYLLSKIDGGLGIALDLQILQPYQECEFKFLTNDGRWIEPHAKFPTFPNKHYPVKNGWFHKERTGRDLFSFRFIETQGHEGSEKWINTRPSGEFGFHFDGKSSTFRIFAPRASILNLLIFENPDEKNVNEFLMSLDDHGTWSCSYPGDLTGKYYKYRITQLDKAGRSYSKEILDPYARATVSRNGPGIALNQKIFSGKKQFYPPPIEDAVVVEAHLRDLLANSSSNIYDSEKLEFVGLTKWLNCENCYLRKLGANVVELQPIQEFDAKEKEAYHWGYMPVNFFSPASVYGTKPDDGSVIEEFAQLVDTFHEAGLAVVLDVVYNHVGIPPHLVHLDKEIYFSTDDGRLSNFSGCGNDLRCESEPVKKIIIDSLIYWVKVFNIDGFRFDLGELIGFELLSEVEVELRKVKPGILLFAEPWSFRGRLSLEMNQTNYALWSDACREELLSYAKNQSGNDLIIELLKGGINKENTNPCQSVNYLESHDDYSLVDRFRDLEIWQDHNNVPDEVVHRAVIAMGILMVSPGVPMISAGQDFLRHKKGIRNTYLLGDINALDYELEDVYKVESSFIRKLIELRLSDVGRRIRYPCSEEWNIHFFSNFSSPAFGFGWESKKTNEKFLITANNQNTQQIIELPEFWNMNARLLLGYRSMDQSPNVLAPLSFSWFKVF